MCPSDTSPEAWKVYLGLVQNMTPGERMQQTFDWSETIRQFHLEGIRQRHPQATEREVFLISARLNLGDELFHKVYGDARRIA